MDKDLILAIHYLGALVEFAETQEKEGLIDGACDPAIFVDGAKELLSRYEIQYGDDFMETV